MLYDQYFIDDLKNRADLVRIIQPYAELKKKGQNWMGCCPFHQEKTPSFSVNPSKGFYKCFGCGKGGSVYNFLMEIEGLNFPEAIKRVAEMSGVMLPEPVDDQQYEQSKKRSAKKKQVADQIIELNQIALEFWEKELQAKNAKAKAARAYLKQRGISEDIQKQFHIGFSPDKWDGLLTVLRDKNTDQKLIEQSGLVSINEEKERVFDRFRGRIMFPVLDVNGRAIAFGARSLDPDDQPKYLNSPETPAYTKGDHLYGLFQAKDEIRRLKFAILVEGYLDLIALAQFGITNTAASLGTAFTSQQAKLLSRWTKKVVINYDGDTAGIAASRKAAEHLLPQEFEIKAFVIPEGRDPDDFVRMYGAERYNEERGKSQRFIQFFTDPMIHGRSLASPQHRAKVAEEMLPMVRAIPRATEKRECFDEIVRLCSINDPELKKKLWNSVKQQNAPAPGDIENVVRKSLKAKVTIAERHLLELLVFDRDLRDVILPLLEPSDFEDLPTAEIFTAFNAIHSAKKEITQETLLEHIGEDEDAVDLARELLIGTPRRNREDAMDTVLHDAENCVFALRNMAIANRIMEISREATLAEQSGNNELFNQLVYEQLELEKICRDLRHHIADL